MKKICETASRPKIRELVQSLQVTGALQIEIFGEASPNLKSELKLSFPFVFSYRSFRFITYLRLVILAGTFKSD
jgi:hypothetical protein